MVMVLDYTPSYCPNCGRVLNFHSRDDFQDFIAGCSHTCDCGAAFAYAQTREVINANSASGGDMEYYHPGDFKDREQLEERLRMVSGGK